MSLTLCVAGSAESTDLGPAGRLAAFAEWVEDELPALAGGPLVRRLAGGGFVRASGDELAALLADARVLASAVASAELEAMVAYRAGKRVLDEEGELVHWPAERAGSWFAATAGGERIGVHRGHGLALWREGRAARYLTHAALGEWRSTGAPPRRCGVVIGWCPRARRPRTAGVRA